MGDVCVGGVIFRDECLNPGTVESQRQRPKELERDRADPAAVLQRREQTFTRARLALTGFAYAAHALFEVEGASQDLACRVGERFRSEKGELANCVAVVGRELGMDDPIGYVPVMQRRRCWGGSPTSSTTCRTRLRRSRAAPSAGTSSGTRSSEASTTV